MNCIKELRETRNITQEEIAETLGVTKQFISRIENGYKVMPLAIAVEIADYLNVSLDELVGRKFKEKK